MTHKKLNNLLIAIIFFMLFTVGVLVLVSTARASITDDIKFNFAAYLMVDNHSMSGFSPGGVGPYVEGWARWKFLELRLNGAVKYEKKNKADHGYTWGYGAESRIYVHDPWYILGAHKTGGYESTFSNGTQWIKHGHHWVLGAGYNDGYTDINIAHYFKEYETQNNSQQTQLAIRQQIWKWLHYIASFSYGTFDQMTSRGKERWTAIGMSVGIGAKF